MAKQNSYKVPKNKYTRRNQLERMLTKALAKNNGMIRVSQRGELVALTIHKASVLLEPGEAEKLAMALADAIDGARGRPDGACRGREEAA
jgi:hypothetical protein